MVQQVSKTPVIYPDRDGLPMSDNTLQFSWIVKIKENLEVLFADRPDVFVAGDLLWYPVEGDNRTCRAPDAMVAFGVSKGYRGSYKQWVENNIAPQVVFEILSPGNRLVEMTEKYEFYDRYGVEEYYLYDPNDEKLTGWQRQEGALVEIQPNLMLRGSANAGWVSPRLGIRLELGETLEIFRPDGKPFRSTVEISQQAEQDQAEAQAQKARADAQAAEAQAQRARADALAAKLRELGLDVDRLR